MEKIFNVKGKGDIHYWISTPDEYKQTLVFLPGLTADHRLFDTQIEYFSKSYRTLVWDAPAHALSRPFRLEFSLADKAQWLHQILQSENITKPILIGQSMGGYVSQCYLELFPNEIGGFVSIDSAPLQLKYYSAIELWLLKHMKTTYRLYPWKILLSSGSKGCATTEYGQSIMRMMMSDYNHSEYARLAAHGYKILAQAIETKLPYKITCPTLLICGENDRAGITKTYNKRWATTENFPIFWIKNAGHNSNTDRPNEVNSIIEQFILSL